MNFFGIHFCQDELFAIMGLLGASTPFVGWIRAKLSKKKESCPCGEDHQAQIEGDPPGASDRSEKSL